MAEATGVKMDNLKTEPITYECEKLRGMAHANVEYYWKDRKLIAGFDCDQSAHCGIRRSPLSGSLNYSVDCPLYISLESNLR